MKKLALSILATTAIGAQAATFCSGTTAYFSVTVPTAADIQGRPGGTAIWIMNPGQTDGAYLTADGRWIYSGTPAYADYRPRSSQPASQVVSACVPDFSNLMEGYELACASHTYSVGGWQIWAAVGGLTIEAEQRINERESRMHAINRQLIDQGRPPRSFDRQRWIESEVAREAKNRAAALLTLPGGLDCRPLEY